jgi:hypothetical protein
LSGIYDLGVPAEEGEEVPVLAEIEEALLRAQEVIAEGESDEVACC